MNRATAGLRQPNYVRAPIVEDCNNSNFWDEDVDVVVVGLGAAGASTAIELADWGKRVMVVERFEGGGATALSGGVVYAGATRHLSQAGYNDTIEDMFAYLKTEVSDAVDDKTLMDFCQESAAIINWLEGLGVRFGSKVDMEKRSYPRGNYDLYFSGNERAANSRKLSRPAPRGHRAIGKGFTGRVLAKTLIENVLSRGVDVTLHSRVDRLVVDALGDVVGVEIVALPKNSAAEKSHRKLIAKINRYQRFVPALALKTARKLAAIENKFGLVRRVRAREGVVLATGSFAFNRSMVADYAPEYISALPVGTVSCDGSGIQLGLSVGAGLAFMERVSAWRSISPPTSFVDGVVVNKQGERFIAEDIYLGHLGKTIVEAQGDSAWVVVDRQGYKRALAEAMPRRNENWATFGAPLLVNLLFAMKRSQNLEGLAQRCGIDSAHLSESVECYNQQVAAGRDPFGKARKHLQPLGEGPYYALDLSTRSRLFPCPSIPMGGLKVDPQSGAVMRDSGARISGLYAAGRCAAGIPSGFYISGTSLADCIYSGRRAARSIAKRYSVDKSA